MDIKEIYHQLTNVDIEEQKRIWDERGIGYYGEYLVFTELYRAVPGCGKILMNLNIPVGDSKTTEIDLILIHETGIYVFEIKHYKGTIYGNGTDPTWTQYFRTVKNNVFKNPILQNDYHLRALRELLPQLPISSFVVFTNSDCDVRVSNINQNVIVCALRDIHKNLAFCFQNRKVVLAMEAIDDIFQKLSCYSAMKDPVLIDGKEADFSSWVAPTIRGLEEKKAEVEHEKAEVILQKKKVKKTKYIGIFSNIAVAIITCVIGFVVTFNVIDMNNRELEKFKQNFLKVDEINNRYIDALNSYVDVSNVSLAPLSEDAISFSTRLVMKNDVYGIALTENSQYIVMTASGKVMAYDVFGEHLRYNKWQNMIGTGFRSYGDLKKISFYGISDVNEVTYIKITGIQLFKLDNRAVIKENLEIELFSK